MLTPAQFIEHLPSADDPIPDDVLAMLIADADEAMANWIGVPDERADEVS